jgi:hypothetical protein
VERSRGFSAIASTGDTIVYPAAGGVYALDLWKITRDTAGTALYHADYAPGNGVFEADWGGERPWRLPAGSTGPGPLAPKQGNDNSPCVLASGEIISLWLNHPANPAGLHELKLLGPNGYSMLVTGKDVSDISIGCGGF